MDLGTSSHAKARALISSYKPRLSPEDSLLKDFRVLVTGFGSYTRRDKKTITHNISGAVADSFAGRRRFSTGQGVVEVRALAFDVLWDVAAAQILLEAENFRPHVILMTGASSKPYGRLEAKAINRASDQPDRLGHFGIKNTENAISLLGYAAQSEVTLSWPARASSSENLGSYYLAYPERLNDSLLYQAESDPNNNYICNQVAYVVQQATNGLPIILCSSEHESKEAQKQAPFAHPILEQGRPLCLKTKNLAHDQPLVAFFHYPEVPDESASPTQLAAWRKFLLALVEGCLQRRKILWLSK